MPRTDRRAGAVAAHRGNAETPGRGITDAAASGVPHCRFVDTTWAIRKVQRGPGLVLDEVPVPHPGEDEVLVRVEAASVCGTDLHIFHWDEWSQHRIQPPLTLGHEFAGTVVEVGGTCAMSQPGDYVSAESHVTCGMCFHCRTGQAHMCERTQILGVDRDGAFAELRGRARVGHLAERPREAAAGDRDAAGAVRQRRLRHEQQDCRALGRDPRLRADRPLQHRDRTSVRRGARSCVGPDAYRLELARTMGATEALNVNDYDDVAERVPRAERGRWARRRIRDVGSSSAIGDAFRIVRNGGRVILFGIPAQPVEIDVAESMIFKNLNVSAVNGRQIWATWYKTRWLLEHGVVDLRPLDDAPASARGLRAGVWRARRRRGVQDRPPPGRCRSCGIAIPQRRRALEPALAAPGTWAPPVNEPLRGELGAELEELRARARTSGSTSSARRRARWSRWKGAAR